MLTTSRLQIDRLVLTFRKNIRMDILEIISKGLVPFTQLVKVRRITWFWHFPASDFHETFTRSSLALNMSRKLLSHPLLAIHGKIMAKKGIFSWKFDLFLTLGQSRPMNGKT